MDKGVDFRIGFPYRLLSRIVDLISRKRDAHKILGFGSNLHDTKIGRARPDIDEKRIAYRSDSLVHPSFSSLIPSAARKGSGMKRIPSKALRGLLQVFLGLAICNGRDAYHARGPLSFSQGQFCHAGSAKRSCGLDAGDHASLGGIDKP